MKTLLKRSLALWLSLTVLLGSVGLTVSEHICLTSGKVLLSYQQQEDPCSKHAKSECEKPAGELALTKKCCEFKLDQHKLEQVAQHKFSQFTFTWIAPLEPTFELLFPTVLPADQEVFLYANSSPPLYGKDLLFSLHILRV